MSCSACQGKPQEQQNGFPSGREQGLNKRASMTHVVAVFQRYVHWLKTCWPGDIVTLGLAVVAAALTGIFTWVARQEDLDARMPEFIELMLLAGILYVIGVFWVDRFRLRATALFIILASAVLFRVVLLSAPPPSTLSDDVYRYQWDGRAQRAHLNPYVVFPNQEGLEWLQNPERPEPPGEETPTIYPPLSEFAYRLIETVPGYRRVSTILDLASAGVLMLLLAAMNQPLHRVLVYAWNPAVLISFAMSGHFDSLAIVTLLAALLLLVTNRPALSMAALALSFLSKFFPVLLLVTFLKRVRLAYLGVFAFLVIAFYIPFSGAGLHLLDGARNYARDWAYNGSFFDVLCFVARSRIGAELLSEEAGRATVVEPHSHGRSAPGVVDGLSLVLHVVDPILMLLPKWRVAADERHLRLGLHSRDHLRSRGTAPEFSPDAVARIRSRLPLARVL